jgi:hypothetical protein
MSRRSRRRWRSKSSSRRDPAVPPRYLIDEQLPGQAAEGMRTMGFEAWWVRDELGKKATDDEVIKHCRSKNCVLVTADHGSRDPAIHWAIAEYDDVAVVLVPTGILRYELSEILCGQWRHIERMCERRPDGRAPYLSAKPGKSIRRLKRPTLDQLRKRHGDPPGGQPT